MLRLFVGFLHAPHHSTRLIVICEQRTRWVLTLLERQRVCDSVCGTRKKDNNSQHSRMGDVVGFGVRPTGNAFFDQRPLVSPGLQVSCLAKLPHPVLLAALEYCDFVSLCRLSSCCRMLYAFGNHPPLWKDLVLERFGGRFDANCSWKYTFRDTWRLSRAAAAPSTTGSSGGAGGGGGSGDGGSGSGDDGGGGRATNPSTGCGDQLSFEGLYSDTLHQFWFHSVGSYPRDWLSVDNIDRRSNLSVEEFNRVYAAGPGRPVILTDVVPKWKAFQLWSDDYLGSKVGDIDFKANGIRISFNRFVVYA